MPGAAHRTQLHHANGLQEREHVVEHGDNTGTDNPPFRCFPITITMMYKVLSDSCANCSMKIGEVAQHVRNGIRSIDFGLPNFPSTLRVCLGHFVHCEIVWIPRAYLQRYRHADRMAYLRFCAVPSTEYGERASSCGNVGVEIASSRFGP